VKVVGTGAPRMLTIRFEPCELEVLRDELEQRRGMIVEAAAHAQEQARKARPALPGAERPEQELERRHDELLLISQLLDDLRRPAPRDEPRDVTGPTWLLGDVIRGASGEAIDRLVNAVSAFREDRGRPASGELRATLAAAAAWVETLIGLDYADNHAVDY
jgi:hypothetical protein